MKASFLWNIELTDGTRYVGAEEIRGGEVHVVQTLPKGHIRSVTGRMAVPLTKDARIFMNGYQTWTWCPEYTVKDRIRSLTRLPKIVVRKMGLDRYSDYHFTEYPDRPGYTHGYSYCYFREEECYELIGSLDETPGYTVFKYNANQGVLTVSRDAEGLACDGPYHAFDLYFGCGEEEDVFDGWFSAMGVVPRTKKPIVGYSSWYNRYQNISEVSIMEDLEGASSLLQKGDLFQVDDGWEPYVGDWLTADEKKFPQEMKAVSDAIHERGLRAGLWLAPFVAETKSSIWREHPDWFLKVNGEPWLCGGNWSGFYALDIDHPEVIAYLKEVFRQIFEVWEYDLVKLDFLYAAAPFGNETETRAGRMIRAMKLLREWCGDRLILACGVPLMPAFGLADYCRVSCDVTLDWDDKFYMHVCHRERPSTKHAIETDYARRQLDGRAFGNDPDVFLLRTQNNRLTPAQKRRLAESCALYGSVFLTSDNMADYKEEETRTFRYLRRVLENKRAKDAGTKSSEA